MNLLALDYGESRIGVAVGNTSSGIAFGRDFISNDKTALNSIIKLCNDDKIGIIVIGKPVMLDGETSVSTVSADNFSQQLQKKLDDRRLNISMKFIDERLTTNIAEQRLSQGKCKQKHRKKTVDGMAAQVILEAYLSRC